MCTRGSRSGAGRHHWLCSARSAGVAAAAVSARRRGTSTDCAAHIRRLNSSISIVLQHAAASLRMRGWPGSGERRRLTGSPVAGSAEARGSARERAEAGHAWRDGGAPPDSEKQLQTSSPAAASNTEASSLRAYASTRHFVLSPRPRTRMKRNIGSPSSSCSADTLAMATWNGWGARRPDPPLAMALCSRSVRGGLRTCRKAAWRAALVFSR